MKLFKIQIVLALVFIGMGNAVYAADLNGIWKSDIETIIIYLSGPQCPQSSVLNQLQLSTRNSIW